MGYGCPTVDEAVLPDLIRLPDSVYDDIERLFGGQVPQDALAARWGTSRATVSRWLHGKNRMPRTSLEDLARQLGINVRDLMRPPEVGFGGDTEGTRSIRSEVRAPYVTAAAPSERPERPIHSAAGAAQRLSDHQANPEAVGEEVPPFLPHLGPDPIGVLIEGDSMRGAGVTLLLEAGEQPHVVSRLAGHSNPAVTQATYTHLQKGAGKRAADLLWTYLGAGPNAAVGTALPEQTPERET